MTLLTSQCTVQAIFMLYVDLFLFKKLNFIFCVYVFCRNNVSSCSVNKNDWLLVRGIGLIIDKKQNLALS